MCFSNYLSKRAVNNTVLMMMMDFGFIHLWNSSYLSGNLSSYKNLVVLCMDKESFTVIDNSFPNQ